MQAIIENIRNTLLETFSAIDRWFDREDALRNYRPSGGGWTINEILEHIGLTNHFLLILINKGTRKALQKVQRQHPDAEPSHHEFHFDKLNEVGQHRSFEWIRPEHMEPRGLKAPGEVRVQLKAQVAECLASLDQLKNGEGFLYKTTMTVNNLGKINVYEYIYFLAQHGRRHIVQMEQVEKEFKGTPAS